MRIDAQAIAQLYETNFWVLTRQAEGITHAQSLIVPDGHDNHMNWAFGHILVGRNLALTWLGGEPVWQGATGAIYKRGHDPVMAENALPFEELVSGLTLSQERLKAALGSVSAEALAAARKERTLGWRLLFGAWHEGYHAGQTEIFRRAAGMRDKIIP